MSIFPFGASISLHSLPQPVKNSKTIYSIATLSVGLIAARLIDSKICLIRGEKALWDVYLTKLYGVLTKVVNQAVARDVERFLSNFFFRFAGQDSEILLKSQSVTSKHNGPGGCRYFALRLYQTGHRYTSQCAALPTSLCRWTSKL